MIPSLDVRSIRLLLTLILVSTAIALWMVNRGFTPVASAQGFPFVPYRNFEGPQVHPLALTPDGTRLLAVNTPNATLSVFQLVSGSPVLTAEIPVGLEPVSVAARNNREAWVVNWMSDSVSIVDLTTGNVARTFDVGDEPTDVLFAGTSKELAFVCISGGFNMPPTGGPTDTVGRGQVKIFDPSNLGAAPQILNLFAKQPRALARDASGARVFVSIFESGNQTTIVPESVVTVNGGLPPPNPPIDAGLPPAPRTSLIVKWNGSDWVDELNRPWTDFLSYTLADIDVSLIDASTGTPFLAGDIHGVGTNNGNMVFDATTNQLAVTNLDSSNAVRFEPNLRGRFQSSRLTFISAQPGAAPAVISTVDLNSQVDLNGSGSDTERVQGLAMPVDISRAADGTMYVAAMSSGRVGVLDAAGSVQARITVGAGPTGLALDQSRSRLYVLNRIDQTISIVDTASKTQLSQVGVGFNPEPAPVRAGRKFLYSADLSRHGTVSCASCHLNGHRDGLAWDLGNPQGQVDHVQTVFGPIDLHPMKGPMMTQSLRGISANTPLHWRGDRATLTNFNPAFVSLLGGPRQLNAQEFDDFNTFIQSLTYPPNPNMTSGGRLDASLKLGFRFFNQELLDRHVLNCIDCHTIRNFAAGTNNLIIPKSALMEPQDFKVPQLRGLYQKVGMNKDGTTPGGEISGFGFGHDGIFDTLANFMLSPQFDFRNAGSADEAANWRKEMTQLLLTLDSGTAPAVGMMTTASSDNKTSFAVTNRIFTLSSNALAGNCDLVVRGMYGGSSRGFLQLPNKMFQSDSRSEAPVSLQQLLNATATGAELTFMGVPPGEGPLFALDRDSNGILNDDEPRNSVSIAGQVVNASGGGVAGVTVTLSGKQSATAVTDALGQYAFNFVSTTGTHVVTPAGAGLNFTPQSRAFTNPIWNQSAIFVTSTTGNVSDISRFFVSQHYADFLNRAPDPAGWDFWTSEIENCGANQDCRNLLRNNVSAAFFLSIEFKETGYLVYRSYKASFGDLPGKPVPLTFSQLMTDTQRLSRNVIVNVGNWQDQIETNKQAFFPGWVQRPEFLARYPAGMAPADFVDALNANTGGSLTPAERDALVNQLTADNSTNGRAAVVRQVAENSEFSQREFNRAFVLMQYFGYLRRNPDDPPETNLNFDGYNFWLAKLNQFNGNFIQAEMVKAFITSSEYRNRFGP